MKLTSDNIKFIDSYLVNSGVKYIDIRMEMVDHIATALEEMEGSFYDTFKRYMAEHKMQLLKANRNFAYAALKSALRQMVLQLAGPWFLIPVSVMATFLFLAKSNFESMTFIVEQAYNICVVLFGFYFIYIHFLKKTKFSVADTLICLSMLTIYISNKIFSTDRIDDAVRMVCFIVFIAFSIAAFRTHLKITSKYKLRYNG